MKRTSILLLLLASAAVAAGDAPRDAETSLRDALFTRVAGDGAIFGPAELDILYFGTTTHLLDEPSHAMALRALDDFAALPDARLPSDPLRRALLLRDLWQLFDWARGEFVTIAATAAQRDALKQRIAIAIRRLRLSDSQLTQLPDNLGELEREPALQGMRGAIRGTKSDWILLGTSGAEPAAPIHVTEQKGRSVFLVLVHFPAGRKAAREWLATLRLGKPDAAAHLNIAAAPFPLGTVWALVRVMNVIDEAGRIRPTHLVESVQFRLYTADPPAERPGFGTVSGGFQQLGELQLNRLHPPALRALAEFDRVFSRGMDIDWLQWRDNPAQVTSGLEPPFKSCQSCHHLMGTRTIRSLVGFEGRATPAFLETSFGTEAAKVVAIKAQRPDWQDLSARLRAGPIGRPRG